MESSRPPATTNPKSTRRSEPSVARRRLKSLAIIVLGILVLTLIGALGYLANEKVNIDIFDD